ncbi:hypothetical protein I656_01362 [Geobacillus sp. WSUCF1]|nr:hypothetical protein I656_01362 [Geobacillus sp. WSUCF1]
MNTWLNEVFHGCPPFFFVSIVPLARKTKKQK